MTLFIYCDTAVNMYRWTNYFYTNETKETHRSYLIVAILSPAIDEGCKGFPIGVGVGQLGAPRATRSRRATITQRPETGRRQKLIMFVLYTAELSTCDKCYNDLRLFYSCKAHYRHIYIYVLNCILAQAGEHFSNLFVLPQKP